MAQPSYAEDRAQIENLQARYMFAIDWLDAERYAETFTEDGELDWARGVLKGRATILAQFGTLRAMFGQDDGTKS
ncbi:MAG TPA: nuclear transport factor 2 family protein, partial [Alphaproteobacteria bacterium]|nr:nuclear transport factor 2 family protein [Alphaproteobacteria bacterium]